MERKILETDNQSIIESIVESMVRQVVCDCDYEEYRLICFADDNGLHRYRTRMIADKRVITKKSKQFVDNLNRNKNSGALIEVKAYNYHNSVIDIIGDTIESAIQIEMRLTQFLQSVQRKLPFTHLITIPFNNQQMRTEFRAFKDSVLSQFANHSIDELLFQNPAKLHATICVLVLLNEKDLLRANKIFKECEQEVVAPIIDNKPLNVDIVGVDVMNSYPLKSHILYAKVSKSKSKSNLQLIADRIVAKFADSGFLSKEEQNKVKLHITFMNSLYRQRIAYKSQKTANNSEVVPQTDCKLRIKRQPFDATSIVEAYKTHFFSNYTIQNIQLNNIKQISGDGFYGVTDIIELPIET